MTPPLTPSILDIYVFFLNLPLKHRALRLCGQILDINKHSKEKKDLFALTV